MKIKLRIFTMSGRLYGHGMYETKFVRTPDIWSEIRNMLYTGQLPGLKSGHPPRYVVLVEIEKREDCLISPPYLG